MIKYSHAYLGEAVADKLDLKRRYKFALVLGNIIPDYLPSCFYFPHTYKHWWKHFNCRRFNLVYTHKNMLFYYNLGKEMHLCADFFTRPHNQDTKTDFLIGHGKWERALNKELMQNLCIDDCYVTNIRDLHAEYLEDEASIENDVKYICKAISSLLNKL
jgi:hypothetical protein